MKGRGVVVLAAALACGALPYGAAAAAALPRSQRPVVVAPPAARPAGAALVGPVASQASISTDIVLKPRHAAGLAAIAAGVSTPGSPERGHYLTLAELRRRFSPSRPELRAVEAWLAAAGLPVASVTPDDLTLHVSSSAGNLEKALQTRLERFRLPGGRIGFANTTSARLPAGIGAAVQAVIGLSSLSRLRPADAGGPVRRAAPTARRLAARAAPTGGPVPCAAAQQQQLVGGYTADQLAAAYGMSGLYESGDLGAGVTVGILELEEDSPSDVAAYEACYGIDTQVSYVPIDGGPGGPATGSGEAALDIEDVAGLAPEADIVVYQAPNTNTGPFDAYQYIVDHPSAEVVTTSWGECEPELANGLAASKKAAEAENTLFQMAAAEGQSWMSASGDSGSTDCNPTDNSLNSALTVDDPGSQPFVTSIGGTSLSYGSGPVSETVWNDSYGYGGATGGGISQLWPMAAYQAAAAPSLGAVYKHSSGKPCGDSAGDCREVPDVSAEADPNSGYVVYYDGLWQTIGGTSGAAPLWAALVALTDAAPSCEGRPVGFLNPVLYQVAGTSAYGSDFRDIKVGDNDYLPSGYEGGLYAAKSGYDMASGLGSPLATSASGGLSAALCSSVLVTRPGVLALSPASGSAKGGTKVTVTGYGFTDVTAVYFGLKAARFSFVKATAASPAKLVAIAPAGKGKQWVIIHNGALTNAKTPGDVFSYATTATEHRQS